MNKEARCNYTPGCIMDLNILEKSKKGIQNLKIGG